MQIIAAIIIIGIIIKFGTVLLIIGLVGVVIWALVKAFSSNDKNIDMSASANQNKVALDQYDFKDSYYPKKGTRTDSDNFWVEPGKTISVSDYSISDGMVYVGTGLSAPARYGIDCALIDPELTVSKNNCDYRVRKMDYWPSYSEVSPEARGSYLKWLAEGKGDPEADIGYVFLYFYGLERRMIYDVEYSLGARNDVDAIQVEIERLLAIYGENRSFNIYANSLLAYIKADDYMKTIIYNQIAPVATYHMGFPLDLRIGLGQMARDGIAIPPDWALSWYLSTPNPPVYARTAAQRCKDEFQRLFAEGYERSFGAGLKVAPNKTKLTINHQPASKSLLGTRTYTKTLDLPDVTVLMSHIKKLAPLVQSCHDKLDSYSRFLGRNPERGDTLDALLELPPSLWPDKIKQAIHQIQSDVVNSSRPIEIKLSALLSNFPEWRDRSKRRMGVFLDILGAQYCLGIEPDCRLGGGVPATDSSVVIFNLGGDQQSVLTPDYTVASLAMYLSVLVSQVDGKVSEEERAMLLNQTDKWIYLKPTEQQRLKAHVLWLCTQNLSMSGVKKRIETLDAAHKGMIGNVVVQVSQVDGTVTVDEMKIMERIFKLLGIDSSAFYSKMHKAAIEPITVMSASSTGCGFLLPSAPTENALPEINLDMGKVAALQKDSEKVTSILSAIFSEELVSQEIQPEQLANDVAEQNELEADCVWGLSPILSEFVQTLLRKQTWERTELEEIADDRGIMLEGALEQINEAAYDNLDQPFAEGEIIVEINQEIVKVMQV